MMLLASATIWTTVARPRKKPIGCGWDCRVQRQIRDLKFSWQWCCIPCEKSAVRWCVRVFKVSFTFQTNLWHLGYLLHWFYLARIDDNDAGFERDNWKKRTKQSEPEEALRADRWYKKNTDEERDNPEQSGLYLIIYITYCVYCTYTAYESYITYDT